MPQYGAPFIGSIQTVEPEWIDYNGHLNMAYFGVLFDRAGAEAFALVGLDPAYFEASKASYYTREAHLTYQHELAVGDPVKVTLQVLDCDASHVHVVQQIFHARENWLSATMEAIYVHIDMTAKRPAPFPPDMHNAIAAMRAAHAALPVPPQVGHLAIARAGAAG